MMTVKLVYMNITEGNDTHQLWERILIALLFLKQRYAAQYYVIYIQAVYMKSAIEGLAVMKSPNKYE